MTEDAKFIEAVKAMDKRTRRVRAYVVMRNSDNAFGRVVFSYPKGGGWKVYVVAWLPDHTKGGSMRHSNYTTGYGHSKANAAMAGATTVKADGSLLTIEDNGRDWRAQLETADFTIIQAV